MEMEATIQGGVAVPIGECSLPEGTKVRITADGPTSESTIWEKLVELGRKADLRETNLPADLAENHDHYLHGLPKKS